MSVKITALSLGAGVQSTTLALLAIEPVVPKPDAAIFADTGWEPRKAHNPHHSAEWADQQTDLLDAIADLEAGVDEDGDLDGCSPYDCRLGLPVADRRTLTTKDTLLPGGKPLPDERVGIPRPTGDGCA
jgi:hypothetical protein